MEAKVDARRKSQNKANKRQKWEYKCAACRTWFPDKEVAVDHIIPVGTLKCEDDLLPFIQRLTVENGYQVLCKPCHQVKTNKERVNAKK